MTTAAAKTPRKTAFTADASERTTLVNRELCRQTDAEITHNPKAVEDPADLRGRLLGESLRDRFSATNG